MTGIGTVGIFALPRALELGGRSWAIRTDYREVLTILAAFEDLELEDGDRAYVCLHNLYEDFDGMPRELYQAAYDAAMAFIDRGGDGRPGPRTMDWTQDAPLIFPAVNRVAGFEVRAVEYLHWWTFLGYFMEIRDSTYATVLSLRQKKARGRRLEKHEKEFWQQNAEICRLKSRLTEAEVAEKARLEAILR